MSSINLQIIDPLLLHLPTSDLYISYDSTSISIHTLHVIITGEVRVLGDVWLRSCDRSVYTQTLSTFGVEDFQEVDLQIETYFASSLLTSVLFQSYDYASNSTMQPSMIIMV